MSGADLGDGAARMMKDFGVNVTKPQLGTYARATFSCGTDVANGTTSRTRICGADVAYGVTAERVCDPMRRVQEPASLRGRG
eukprot:3214336-Rhodomonas_salina.2